MVDSKSTQEEPVDEPAVAKLISAKEVELPTAKPWQMSSFDQVEKERKSKVTQEVYQEIKNKMEPEIVKQAELVKKEAYEKAYQEGYEAGYQSGAELGKQEAAEQERIAQNEAFAPKIVQMEELISAMELPYQSLQTEVFEQLANLAVHIAKQVVEKEVATHPEWIVDAIQNAVKVLPDDETPFVVEVSPADYQFLQSQPQTIDSLGSLKQNPELAQGVCTVKQANSSIVNDWRERMTEVMADLESKILSENP